MQRAEADTRRFKIPSVPTMMVAGKYLVFMDNGHDRALEVVEELIERERGTSSEPG